jgi:hypothetical protein
MDYNQMVQDLMARQEETQSRASDDRFKSIFKRDMPPGVKRRKKITEGEHLVDILIYQCGDRHPGAKDGPPLAKGSPAFALFLEVHQKVGPRESDYVCMSQVWGGKYRCPVCEWRLNEMKKTIFNKEIVDAHRSKQQTLMNSWWHETPELEREGNLIWMFSYFSFLKPVTGQATIPFGGGFIPWYLPTTDGKGVYFKREGSGKNTTKYVEHKLMDRRSQIPEEILKQAYPLDELVHWPEYEEVHEEFFMAKPEEGSNATISIPPQTNVETPPQQQTTSMYDMSAISGSPSGPAPAEPAPPKCPGGGTYGKDCEQLPGGLCNGCAVWDGCSQLTGNAKPVALPAEVKPEQTLPPADPPAAVETTTPAQTLTKATVVRRRR